MGIMTVLKQKKKKQYYSYIGIRIMQQVILLIRIDEK